MNNTGLLLAAVAVLLAVLLLAIPGTPPAPERAPEFSLASLDGEITRLSDLRGQLVILDFWASWCKPCTRTFPVLHDVAMSYADRGVVLLVVSLDKSAEVAREALGEAGYGTEGVLYGSLQEARAVKALYNVGGIPHTFVIDRDGWIRYSGQPSGVNAQVLESWL
ncbi:MAG: TlpA disulfide reductase family protein [Candidatus Bipolaricaulota bacterium]